MWWVDQRVAALIVDERYRAPETELAEANQLGSVARFLDGRCVRGSRAKQKADRTRRSTDTAHLNRSASKEFNSLRRNTTFPVAR